MDFQINGKYSFEVYPVAVLGTAFKNVQILGTFGEKIAQSLGLDTRAMHAAVYPSLPSYTPNDPSKYLYVQLLLPNGETTIIGMAWIKADTVVTVNLGKFLIEIDNESASESQAIINALAANGKKVTSIEFVQSGQ
jgi:hypothetical protein